MFLCHVSRARPDAWWIADDIAYIVYAPLLTVVSALATGTAAKGFLNLSTQPVSGAGWALVVASIVAASVAVYLLSMTRNVDRPVAGARMATSQ